MNYAQMVFEFMEKHNRLFPPTLLDDPQVVIIAAYQEQRVVAGAIANLSGQAVSNRVVGLSNVFTPAESPESFWAGLLNYAQHHFPGLPLVGYEQGSVLEAAIAVGFEPISPLRVRIFQDTNTF